MYSRKSVKTHTNIKWISEKMVNCLCQNDSIFGWLKGHLRSPTHTVILSYFWMLFHTGSSASTAAVCKAVLCMFQFKKVYFLAHKPSPALKEEATEIPKLRISDFNVYNYNISFNNMPAWVKPCNCILSKILRNLSSKNTAIMTVFFLILPEGQQLLK